MSPCRCLGFEESKEACSEWPSTRSTQPAHYGDDPSPAHHAEPNENGTPALDFCPRQVFSAGDGFPVFPRSVSAALECSSP
jgi:hypothetical protein